MIRSRLLRGILFKIGRVDPLMHVRLVAPPGEPEVDGAAYTIAYVDGQSLIVPGFHGRVRQVYWLTVADAAEYQRHMLRARKANNLLTWVPSRAGTAVCAGVWYGPRLEIESGQTARTTDPLATTRVIATSE